MRCGQIDQLLDDGGSVAYPRQRSSNGLPAGRVAEPLRYDELARLDRDRPPISIDTGLPSSPITWTEKLKTDLPAASRTRTSRARAGSRVTASRCLPWPKTCTGSVFGA